MRGAGALAGGTTRSELLLEEFTLREPLVASWILCYGNLDTGAATSGISQGKS